MTMFCPLRREVPGVFFCLSVSGYLFLSRFHVQTTEPPMNPLLIPSEPLTRAAKPTPDTTGQVKTKARPQALGRTSLVLTFSPSEAVALRALSESLRFPNGKSPSMALLARRGLEVYRAGLSQALRRSDGVATEHRALARLASGGAQQRTVQAVR
jgi:hypothetical protein